jgi:hypothetical protein
VPFQNNLNYPIGPFTRYQDVLNIQPVIPIGIGQQWNLITRAILPVINRQDPLSEGGTRAGLGDFNVTFFLSPAKPGRNRCKYPAQKLSKLTPGKSSFERSGFSGLSWSAGIPFRQS